MRRDVAVPTAPSRPSDGWHFGTHGQGPFPAGRSFALAVSSGAAAGFSCRGLPGDNAGFLRWGDAQRAAGVEERGARIALGSGTGWMRPAAFWATRRERARSSAAERGVSICLAGWRLSPGLGIAAGCLAERAQGGRRWTTVNWAGYAVLPAVFAGLTALLAKTGVPMCPSNLASDVHPHDEWLCSSPRGLPSPPAMSDTSASSPRATGYSCKALRYCLPSSPDLLLRSPQLRAGPRVAPIDKLSFVLAMALGVFRPR